MLGQNFKNSVYYLAVIFQDLSKDKNIIQIDYYNFFSYKILKNIIHYSLEYNRTINYTKKHYQKFKKTTVHTEGSVIITSSQFMHAFLMSCRVQGMMQ